MEDRRDWLATVFIVLMVGIGLGYGWRWAQEPLQYEQGYLDAIAEVDVVTEGEICQ